MILNEKITAKVAVANSNPRPTRIRSTISPALQAMPNLGSDVLNSLDPQVEHT